MNWSEMIPWIKQTINLEPGPVMQVGVPKDDSIGSLLNHEFGPIAVLDKSLPAILPLSEIEHVYPYWAQIHNSDEIIEDCELSETVRRIPGELFGPRRAYRRYTRRCYWKAPLELFSLRDYCILVVNTGKDPLEVFRSTTLQNPTLCVLNIDKTNRLPFSEFQNHIKAHCHEVGFDGIVVMRSSNHWHNQILIADRSAIKPSQFHRFN